MDRERLWTESEGNVFIIVSTSLATAWEGTNIPSPGRTIEAVFRWDGPGSPATDYDRACDIDSDVGLLTIGHGVGVVLGEPGMLSWQPFSQGGGALVGWGWADSDEDVEEALKHLSYEGPQPTCFFDTDGEELLVFDPAYDGAEALSGVVTPLRFKLSQGRYGIAREDWSPNPQTRLIIYRVIPQ